MKIFKQRTVKNSQLNHGMIGGIAGKFIVGIVAPLLLFSLLFSAVLYFVSQNIITKQVLPQFEAGLTAHMNVLHDSVSPALVQGAIHNKEDYIQILKILNTFKHNTPGIQNAYVMSKINGKDVILALSDDNKYLYPLAFTAQQNQSLQMNKPVMSSIYSDAWGVHKSLFIPYENAHSFIGLDIDASFMPQLQHMILVIDILIIIGAILVGTVISFFEARYFSKPIIALSKWANQLAKGNLSSDTFSETFSKRKDELGELSVSFNRMAKNFRDIISAISAEAIHVASTAEELSASAEETAKATDQIASSIQMVAVGVEKQALGATESSNAMEDMASGVQHVAEMTSVVTDSAMSAASNAEQGNILVQNTIQGMEELNSALVDTEGKLKELDDHSRNIGQIVDVITEIAGQTSLLALNAAIEAARAGDEGRGFAVVASEVRSLAEKTTTSAHEIVEIIDQVKSGTNDSVKSMQIAMEKAQIGLLAVQDTGKSFSNILQVTRSVAEQIQEVSATSEKMSAETEEVTASIEEMASISRESAAHSESVSAASEEQLASIEEIASSANTLSESAQELQKTIGSFKL